MRWRPFWTFSARKHSPAQEIFSGSPPALGTPPSSAARMMPAVASGRSVNDRSPRSVKVYISLLTMSVEAPTPRENTSVCSKTGVRIRW